MENSIVKQVEQAAPIQVHRAPGESKRPGEYMRDLVGLSVAPAAEAAWRATQEKRLQDIREQIEQHLPDPKKNEEAYENAKAKQHRDLCDLAEIYKSMAPPGSLGLVELWGEEEGGLLEAARFKYSIPDGVFTTACAYDWIHTVTVPEFDDALFHAGTGIQRTQAQEDATWVRSARALIVGAGLRALYELHSHGMGIGHIVGAVRPTPYRKMVDAPIRGKPYWVTLYRAGDLHDSETTLAKLISGELKRVFVPGTGYVYEKNGQQMAPAEPFAAEDQ